jgi:Cytidine deaminase
LWISRQRMSEFNTENVIVVNNDGYKKYKFSEILPFDFKF